MKHIVPEIYINDCKNAILYYKSLFGGDIRNLQMSDDNELFKNIKNKVIHSELHINSDCILYFIDKLDCAASGNITLMLHLESEEEIKRIYKGLKKGADIKMELQETFTGSLHAILTDKFGSSWALNYSYPSEVDYP